MSAEVVCEFCGVCVWRSVAFVATHPLFARLSLDAATFHSAYHVYPICDDDVLRFHRPAAVGSWMNNHTSRTIAIELSLEKFLAAWRFTTNVFGRSSVGLLKGHFSSKVVFKSCMIPKKPPNRVCLFITTQQPKARWLRTKWLSDHSSSLPHPPAPALPSENAAFWNRRVREPDPLSTPHPHPAFQNLRAFCWQKVFHSRKRYRVPFFTSPFLVGWL